MSEWFKLSGHLYNVCAVFPLGEDEIAQIVWVFYTSEGNGLLNMVQQSDFTLQDTIMFTFSTEFAIFCRWMMTHGVW